MIKHYVQVVQITMTILQTVMKWVEHQPGERLQFLSSLVSEIDVWQVPAEKLLVVVNSELLLRRLRDSVATFTIWTLS